ncbi:MAG: S16 family serine protease, partial [Candidatus Woesearchaeota archaeon]
MAFAKKILIILAMAFILLVAAIPAQAKSGHITLLTVVDLGNESEGGTADLYLDVRQGTGAIFIDSLPLTKLDTQISTRIANEIACDFLRKDCSKYDFFYRIRADSSVVGGPSAGAGIAVLTASVLDNLDLRQDAAITGTINSGAIIGPVSGLKEKALAAQRKGLNMVLLPSWFIAEPSADLNLSNASLGNFSLINWSAEKKESEKEFEDFIESFSENYSTKIVRVSNLGDALFYFTGKKYDNKKNEILVPEEYTLTMKRVSESLCKRTEELSKKASSSAPRAYAEDANISGNASSLLRQRESTLNKTRALQEKSSNLTKAGRHYSAASYCFTANVALQKEIFGSLSEEELKKELLQTKRQIDRFEKYIDNKQLETIANLEVYMLVKERTVEAKELLDKQDRENISASETAYAIERYVSAISWAEFFDFPGKKIKLDEEHLRAGCLKKIKEVEERTNYMRIFFPALTGSLEKDLSATYESMSNSDYELCIFTASKVKAGADGILSSAYLDREQLNSFIEEQLYSVKKLIISEQEQDF